MKNNPLSLMNSQQLRNLADLMDQRDALNARIENAVNGSTPASEASTNVPIKHKRAKRRKMSRETRAKMSAVARARWSKAKAAGRTSL